MTAQRDTFDISDLPELAQAVDAARAAGRRLTIVRDGADVAELVPLDEDLTERTSEAEAYFAEIDAAIDLTEALRGLPPNSVTARTAGAARKYGRYPPLTPREEKEAFAQAVAEENSRSDND